MKKVVIFIVLVLAGIGSFFFIQNSRKTMTDMPVTVDETPVEGNLITIQNFKHSPGKLIVKPGQEVNIMNMDMNGHSVTSDDGKFDSGVIASGQTGKFIAPTTPGEYKYHCTPHPTMKGAIIVQE